jgi:hypothetical protein
MVLSDEDIVKFQSLYKKRFDKDLTPQEAYEKAVKVLGLVSIVYRPMKRAELEAVQKRQAQLLKKQK